MPQRELSTLQLAPQHLQLLQALLHTHVPEAQVWAYGSRVTGGAHEGSDLDLVLRNPATGTQVSQLVRAEEAHKTANYPCW